MDLGRISQSVALVLGSARGSVDIAKVEKQCFDRGIQSSASNCWTLATVGRIMTASTIRKIASEKKGDEPLPRYHLF